jgi:hypothetical protein
MRQSAALHLKDFPPKLANPKDVITKTSDLCNKPENLQPELRWSHQKAISLGVQTASVIPPLRRSYRYVSQNQNKATTPLLIKTRRSNRNRKVAARSPERNQDLETSRQVNLTSTKPRTNETHPSISCSSCTQVFDLTDRELYKNHML